MVRRKIIDKKIVIGLIVIVLVAIIALGYFLFNNEKENNNTSNDNTVVNEPNNNDQNDNNTIINTKTLVVYYSAQNHTKEVAEEIAKNLNADIFVIEPVNEYTSADLNYNDEESRVSKEHNDESLRNVELKNTKVENWDKYDTVLIGYPIWWGIAAWPVNTFVSSNDFTNKTVIPFCTSASSSLGESGKLLENLAKTGNWQEGTRFSSNPSSKDIRNLLIILNRGGIRMIKQTAGRDQLNDFAPAFAHYNDDILFGENWNDQSIDIKTRCIITVVALMSSGITDNSLKYHLENAKKNNVTKEEMVGIITHTAFYVG